MLEAPESVSIITNTPKHIGQFLSVVIATQLVYYHLICLCTIMPAFRYLPRHLTFDRDVLQLPPEPSLQPKRRRSLPVRPITSGIMPISVLFVDSYNQVRSVMAQAQAELVRLWTLNRVGRNLFSCIDSAGLRVNTPLNRHGVHGIIPSGRPLNRPAIDAVLDNYNFIVERNDIRHRLLNKQTSRGVTYSDFERFDYIFCFDLDSFTELQNLQRHACERAHYHGRSGLRAKTRLLGDYSPRSGLVEVFSPALSNTRNPHRSELEPTVRAIEAELYNFLEVRLSWTPERVSSWLGRERNRSRQFAASYRRATPARIRMLQSLYNDVHVDNEIDGRETRTVTVTAREGRRLEEVYADAKALLS